MSAKQNPCSPLDFDNVFLKLLADMDGEIHRIRSGERSQLNAEKMVRYQTLIAAGGYFGPRAKELLSLKWFDIVGKKETSVFYQFKTGKNRKVYFAPSFIKLAERNYRLIDPINLHHLVLHKRDNPMEPVATRDFNENLAYYFERFGVVTENPSSHTLRKTFMNHAWQQLGGDERAYLTVGKMMGYASKEQVMDYLGHTQKQIREAVLRFK